MLATRRDPRLERELARAGSQWKDEDLDEIMALLDKDYTKPQSQPKDELDELKELLDKDYTKAEPEKAPHFPPLFGGGPIFGEPDREEPAEEAPAEPAPEQPPEEAPAREESGPEEAPQETAIPTLGEQADFTDAPAEPAGRKLPLTIIAAAELVALAGIAVWFLLWIR